MRVDSGRARFALAPRLGVDCGLCEADLVVGLPPDEAFRFVIRLASLHRIRVSSQDSRFSEPAFLQPVTSPFVLSFASSVALSNRTLRLRILCLDNCVVLDRGAASSL
jgi:hypothetical protein